MPVHIVTGTESVFRRREIKRLVGEAPRIVYTREELADALDPGMFEDPKNLWCRDLTWTEGMVKETLQYEGTVVVEVEGELPAKGPWSKKKELAKWVETPSPKPWERRQVACDFVRDEAMRLQIVLSEALGVSLVTITGTDLGVLAFELQKLALFLQETGTQQVLPKHIAQIRGGFVETGVEELVFGVGQRAVPQVMQSLSLIEKTMGTGTSVVLRICGILVYNARIWLACKTLCGGEAGALGERLGIHPFVLKKQHFPHAIQWTERGLLELLHGIAGVQRGIRRGQILSFLRMTSLLLRLLQKPT